MTSSAEYKRFNPCKGLRVFVTLRHYAGVSRDLGFNPCKGLRVFVTG